MLDELKEIHDDIAKTNEWDASFIESVAIQKENTPDMKLSGKQFKIISSLYEKYRSLL